jgi:enediyne biosynthesis protein E4
MGVDAGDYDNDGDLDLIVTNFSDDYNTLYRNDGPEQFTDVSYPAGLGQATWSLLSWGAQFVDIDNDGALDLAIANGHVYPEVDRHGLGSSYRQPLSLFLNLANGRFAAQGRDRGPAFSKAESSRGLAIGDIDNDGFSRSAGREPRRRSLADSQPRRRRPLDTPEAEGD